VAVAPRLVRLDGFGAAVRVTLPLPVLLAVLRVSQACALVAVQAASGCEAVTVTVCAPPPAGAAQVVGVTVKVGVAAACVTATVWFPIVTVVLRLLALEGFTAAVSVRLPLPVPLAVLRVSQACALVAVQAASVWEAVTVIVCAPPPAGAAQVVGVTVKLAVPAAWVTDTGWPARVAVALRLVRLDGFGAAVRVTLPLPLPLAALRVSQACALVAVQTASVCEAVTVIVCVPPSAEIGRAHV
jgi:hypothetical protein